MRVFEKEEIQRLLSYPVCMELMRTCFIQLTAGEITQPVRTGIGLPKGALAYMPCHLKKQGTFGAKILSVYPENATEGHPSHQGYVLLFEEEHGTPVLMADACAITEIRTAAASACATSLLARPDAKNLALIGSGAQAKTHLLAMRQIRPLSSVTIWSYHKENAQLFAMQYSIPDLPIRVCDTVQEAVSGADLICTLCHTTEPLLEAAWVRPGTHINAVGTCGRTSRDLAGELVAASRLYVDQREAALAGSGNYLIPLSEGVIQKDHLLGSIGEVLLNRIPGRTSPDEITVFESQGLAAEDILCADYLFWQSQFDARQTNHSPS